jgi:hypothetical protein
MYSGWFCSQMLCQWAGPEPCQPGTITTLQDMLPYFLVVVVGFAGGGRGATGHVAVDGGMENKRVLTRSRFGDV